jgi:hypothetical protein
VNVYSVPHELTSPQWAAAFAAGHPSARIVADDRLRAGPLALFGSPVRWALLEQARAAGHDWFYGDHAYFRRGEFFRCTRGRLQLDVRAAARDARPRRWEQLRVQTGRRRTAGSHVLLCLQSDAHFRLRRIPSWPSDIAAEIARHTDRPVLVRTKATTRPLRVDLWRSHVVITHSSMCAVHAVLAGVPCIALDPDSVGAAFGSTSLQDIESPHWPLNREPLLWALAEHQWTLDEYRRGVAWRNMQ